MKDDGRGINGEDVYNKAIEKGLIDSTKDFLNEKEKTELIFKPGFSTASNVTEISGRGVGMDVVAERMKELEGSITLDSTEGKGTTFILKMKSGKKAEINRTVFPLKKFKEIIVKNIIQTVRQKSFLVIPKILNETKSLKNLKKNNLNT